MPTEYGNHSVWLSLVGAVALLSLTACGLSAANATSTPEVDAVFTVAFQTYAANQARQLALNPPTLTPPPLPFPVLPPPSPLGGLPFVIPSSTASTARGCNDAAYVADVTIPDGTSIEPGASFDKTWTLRNTGSCAWSTSYSLAYSSGDKMKGSAAFLPASVASADQVDLTVKLVAPSDAGSYTGFWRMRNDLGQTFGGSVSVVIDVPGAGLTATSGPTLSPADLTATALAVPTAGGPVTISGNILNWGGGNFTISWKGNQGIDTSQDFDGNAYSISVPTNWTGKVTPSKSGRTFDPASLTYQNLTANMTGQNFTIH